MLFLHSNDFSWKRWMIVNEKGGACWIKDEKIAWKIIQGYDYALLSDKNNALNSVKKVNTSIILLGYNLKTRK